MRAYEIVAGGQTDQRITHRVTIRYRPGVEATMRVVDDAGVVFAIRGPARDVENRRQWLELLCEEGVDNGR